MGSMPHTKKEPRRRVEEAGKGGVELRRRSTRGKALSAVQNSLSSPPRAGSEKDCLVSEIEKESEGMRAEWMIKTLRNKN